jgi:hypothetical protein
MDNKSIEFGELKNDRRRSRKPKRQNEKELMNEYYTDFEKEKNLSKQRKFYENMQYLSHNERNLFENKFTKPKNISQEDYASILKNKTMEINHF